MSEYPEQEGHARAIDLLRERRGSDPTALAVPPLASTPLIVVLSLSIQYGPVVGLVPFSQAWLEAECRWKGTLSGPGGGSS